jgi:hypothetical protein
MILSSIEVCQYRSLSAILVHDSFYELEKGKKIPNPKSFGILFHYIRESGTEMYITISNVDQNCRKPIHVGYFRNNSELIKFYSLLFNKHYE